MRCMHAPINIMMWSFYSRRLLVQAFMPRISSLVSRSKNHSPVSRSNRVGRQMATISGTTTAIDIESLLPETGEARRALETVLATVEQNLKSTTPLDQLERQLSDLEREQSEPSFWDDTNKSRATVVNSQLSNTARIIQRISSWQKWKDDATTALELWKEETDDTERKVWWSEFTQALQSLQQDADAYSLEILLSGPYDEAPARLILTAGAGGTEANDWVADLRRMYERHCASRGFHVALEDEQPGETVGYKSVELLITGPNAFGWLQGEKGTHRLVRLSPFNANNKRQTTFAGVDVAPDIMEESETLSSMVIPDVDLEITTMRAGGKGGQNVNKIESAVRVKHIPSGLQVKCSQERTQSRNKDIALARIKSQLLAITQEQRLADYQQIRGDVVEASWGTQIRNYVLHPYKMVKDQRTGWETTNTQALLDGDLDDCIGAYLRWKADQRQEE